MAVVLEFEKPIQELENKIDELRKFSSEKGIDLSNEIDTLEKRAAEVRKSIYSSLNAWQHVLIARHPERPHTDDYINYIFDDFIELHGDRCFGDDPAVAGGICRFNGRPVTVIGQMKGKDTNENLARNFGMAHPEGYRKAIRLMKQAEKFNRPVICFIDTPGAYPGIGAEERGQFEAIAQSMLVMSALKAPIITVVIGEGFSGGALGIGVGDRILMQEHAIYSVITPEGYASILWKDAARAREAAEAIRIIARDIRELGVADKIVSEPLGGAHRDPEAAAAMMGRALAETLDELLKLRSDDLLQQRYEKFRSIGILK